MNLAKLVVRTAERYPDRLAVCAADAALTYRDLDRQANQLARVLHELGVHTGTRVGIWMDKSARAIIAMQATLRLGAAYVPLDPLSPLPRLQAMALDCSLTALVTDKPLAAQLQSCRGVALPAVCTAPAQLGVPWDALEHYSGAVLPPPAVTDDSLCYILYTSGSTGVPKGVCISHRNALAFITWAARALDVTPDDRLLGHAPFHFDLSVFDLYGAFAAGAAVYLVPEGLAYAPERLVTFIVSHQITICYMVPSALTLLMKQGRLLEAERVPRAVICAGEPFAVSLVQQVRERWPSVRLLNFYGPTETNVCTYYEVRSSPSDLPAIPIGQACSGDSVWAVTPAGTPAGFGEEGELCVSGPTVMLGYWGQPPQGAKAYRTGDIVRLLPDGNYAYIGRRDGMVKVRGNRVELAEIEAVLLADRRIREAAVVVVGDGLAARLGAYIVVAPNEPVSLLEVKRLCAAKLARYMIVDWVQQVEVLPRTTSGKIDRRALMASAPEVRYGSAG